MCIYSQIQSEPGSCSFGWSIKYVDPGSSLDDTFRKLSEDVTLPLLARGSCHAPRLLHRIRGCGTEGGGFKNFGSSENFG